jgi:hypothetical protein
MSSIRMNSERGKIMTFSDRWKRTEEILKRYFPPEALRELRHAYYQGASDAAEMLIEQKPDQEMINSLCDELVKENDDIAESNRRFAASLKTNKKELM